MLPNASQLIRCLIGWAILQITKDKADHSEKRNSWVDRVDELRFALSLYLVVNLYYLLFKKFLGRKHHYWKKGNH